MTKLPKEFIDMNPAFARVPGEPKRYVQDRLRERGEDVATRTPTPTSAA